MASPSAHILIIGAGISGLSAALAICTFLPNSPQITIYEGRDTLPTLGGAINLTPNGLRYLSRIGALPAIKAHGAGADVRSIDLFSCESGASISKIDFANPDGSGLGDPPFNAMRIRRADLLQGTLNAVNAHENVKVEFGKKVSSLSQTPDLVTLSFADGTSATGTMMLGCDGIHSAVRSALEPNRTTQYTGITIVNGYTSVQDNIWVPERDTSFLTGHTGSFFASYYEPTRTKLFVTGLWDVPEVESRAGWRAKGADQEALQEELKRRFGQGKSKGVCELIDSVNEWSLYPVYNLPPNGKWWEGRVMLLGDAAHAMSPQGESATIAMEDSIVFARMLSQQGERTLEAVFVAYERHRRTRVEAAYKEADFRWKTVRDQGWLQYKITEWITPFFLWLTAGKRRRAYEEDLSSGELAI